MAVASAGRDRAGWDRTAGRTALPASVASAARMTAPSMRFGRFGRFRVPHGHASAARAPRAPGWVSLTEACRAARRLAVDRPPLGRHAASSGPSSPPAATAASPAPASSPSCRTGPPAARPSATSARRRAGWPGATGGPPTTTRPASPGSRSWTTPSASGSAPTGAGSWPPWSRPSTPTTRARRADRLREAEDACAEYGRIAGREGLGAPMTADLFLRFRRPFLAELGCPRAPPRVRRGRHLHADGRRQRRPRRPAPRHPPGLGGGRPRPSRRHRSRRTVPSTAS